MLNSSLYVSHLENQSGEPRDVVYETQSSNSMRVRGISEDNGEKSDVVHRRELVRHMSGMNRGAGHVDMTDYRCLVR
jgi:4-hydroxy-3-methylbut-2-enyl diphosphate reductase IspH